jgi:parallel beta helix pectate lyase-like protein
LHDSARFEIRMLSPLYVLALCALSAAAAEIRVPADAPDLTRALAAANAGDIILLGAGEFVGGVTIDKPLVIRGVNAEETVITGDATAIRVAASLVLENLAVRGAETGVYVEAGCHLELLRCAVAGAAEDGIGFANSSATTLEMRACLVTGNGDGVDLESTQGLIMDSRFSANRDDGLDYDGDARVTCVDCQFADNGDDGVEVRLARTTHAVFTRCEFAGNGEDGLEFINSPLDNPNKNVVILGLNSFRNNGRWGLGFVTAEKPEEALDDDISKAALMFGPNEFSNNAKGAVSPNHALEMTRAQPTENQITIDLVPAAGGERKSYTVPLHRPLPLATVSMKPPLVGPSASDVEGIAVMGSRMLVADDNLPGIHIVDLATGESMRRLTTAPLPGTDLTVTGTEGLTIVERDGKPTILLSCDDDDLVVTLDATEDRFGALLDRVSTKEVAPYCEGLEQVGDRIYAVHGNNTLCALNASDFRPIPDRAFTIRSEGYGGHIAGIGFDGERLLITSSAFKERMHTHNGLIIALALDSCAPIEAWHIPYLDDPRGVACANGLAWVADGMSPYTDKQLGRRIAIGLRIMLFSLGGDARNCLRLRDLPGPRFGDRSLAHDRTEQP